MNDPSSLLVWSFTSIALLVGAAFPIGLYWALRRTGVARARAVRGGLLAALGVVVWMAATYRAAAAGILEFDRFPPPFVGLFLLIVIIAFALGFSRLGKLLATAIPTAFLVGFHGFRVPLELVMHRAYSEGIMPVQMSYSGYNFDILTGISALILGVLLVLARPSFAWVWLWNVAGSLLLLNVVVIAWLSTPTPMRLFMNEPVNVWITYPPFVWLPAVMVLAATLGHIVIFRRLLIRKEVVHNSASDIE
jgi:hypothetical protein